jgi:NADH-quinone oxidoreductase subunit N
VLQAVVQIGWWWVAVIAVVFSLIGAFYYLRIVKLMYFDAPLDPAPVTASGDVRALLSANGLAVLVLGIAPQPLMVLCIEAVRASI